MSYLPELHYCCICEEYLGPDDGDGICAECDSAKAFTDGVHLVASTLYELHSFAQTMGLKREWFQDHPYHPHYDLTTKRAVQRALDRGAVMVSSRAIVQLAHNMD